MLMQKKTKETSLRYENEILTITFNVISKRTKIALPSKLLINVGLQQEPRMPS